MSDTIFVGDFALSSFQGGGSVFAFTNTTAKGEDTVTTLQVDTKEKVGTIASWGAANDYPQDILKRVKLNGAATSALRLLRKAHYGNGLVLMTHGATEEGKHEHKVVPIESQPAIKDFFSKSQMPRFWKETITDLEYFSIAFPEYVLSNDYTKINRVKRQKAAWCRFEVMNENSGLIENVYISEKFGKTSVATDSVYCATVPLIDSYWSADEVKEYCRRNKIHNFVRPVFYPLIDEAYYPEAEWHSVTKSGWLDVANSIPEYKNNLFKNQVSIKYLIEIDERYFKQIYLGGEWEKYTPEERKAIRKKVIDSINDHLSGNTNAGKSIQSMKLVDGKGDTISAITITTIDDKFKDGSYLPEAEAANSEILFAIGVDPSLVGAGIPGGKLGAGSGSDKSAAFNILSALFKTNRETTLEVFDFIRDFNGWDKSITGAFENTILTTLDKNPTGSQKTTN
jgi:hypothetical protein